MFSLKSLVLSALPKKIEPSVTQILEAERQVVFAEELEAIEALERAFYTVKMLQARRARLTRTLQRVANQTLHCEPFDEHTGIHL